MALLFSLITLPRLNEKAIYIAESCHCWPNFIYSADIACREVIITKVLYQGYFFENYQRGIRIPAGVVQLVECLLPRPSPRLRYDKQAKNIIVSAIA